MDAKPGDEAAAVGLRERARRWLAERELRQWWKAGLAAIVAVAALFGGLDTVNTSVTVFNPGEEFSDGEFTVTVDRGRLVDELTGGRGVVGRAMPGRRYLAVVATIRNDGTIPGRLRDELDLRDVPDKEFFGVLRLRDGSFIQTLGPGLTEELVFAWSVPEGAVKSADVVTLRVWKKMYTQLKVTYGGEQWIDSLTDYSVVLLPVKAPS